MDICTIKEEIILTNILKTKSTKISLLSIPTELINLKIYSIMKTSLQIKFLNGSFAGDY